MKIVGFIFNIQEWDYHGKQGLSEVKNVVINAISDKYDDYFCVYPSFVLIDSGEAVSKISNSDLKCSNIRNAILNLTSSFNDIDEDIERMIFVIGNKDSTLDDHTLKLCHKISKEYTKIYFISIINPIPNFTCINTVEELYALITKES